jgi:hypothetical protein
VGREGFPDGAADAAVADRLSLQAGGHVNRVGLPLPRRERLGDAQDMIELAAGDGDGLVNDHGRTTPIVRGLVA